MTNAHGYYTVPYLTPGTYNVTAESRGFSTSIISGVHLTVNLSTSVDLKLTVGAVSQQLVVQANAIQLETENSELGGTVSRQQILELPQVGRDAYHLALLQPVVLPDQNSALQPQINSG